MGSTSRYFIDNLLARLQWIVFSLVVIIQSNDTAAQLIPSPLGKYAIGHHRFEWTDSSRIEIFEDKKAKRQLVADIWYPAQQQSKAIVIYLDTQLVKKAFGSDGLKSMLGIQGATAIRSGRVQSHAKENAPFELTIRSAPVVFFSHGMGMITQFYTTQIEELASHGYIVVALNHPYDAWIVSFKDGAFIPLETTKRTAASKSEEDHIIYENQRVEWWAADIIYALNRLTEINLEKSKNIPFAGRMDLSAVGAMGHSVGGRAAARACQRDQRFKSCANQDGVANMQPFYRNTDGVGMKQQYLLFERDLNAKLTSADAKSMGMEFDQLLLFIDSLRRMKTAALASTGGSFHILLNFRSSTHMSFSDLPLLQAENETEAAHAFKLLRVTSRYTREFFDKTLRGIPAPLFEGKEMLPFIDRIEQFPPMN